MIGQATNNDTSHAKTVLRLPEKIDFHKLMINLSFDELIPIIYLSHCTNVRKNQNEKTMNRCAKQRYEISFSFQVIYTEFHHHIKH